MKIWYEMFRKWWDASIRPMRLLCNCDILYWHFFLFLYIFITDFEWRNSRGQSHRLAELVVSCTVLPSDRSAFLSMAEFRVEKFSVRTYIRSRARLMRRCYMFYICYKLFLLKLFLRVYLTKADEGSCITSERYLQIIKQNLVLLLSHLQTSLLMEKDLRCFFHALHILSARCQSCIVSESCVIYSHRSLTSLLCLW